MLNLLLPSAQGTVCSHRHYLNRSAVEQDSKKDDETAPRVIALVGGQKTEMRHLKFCVAADQPVRLTWNFGFLPRLHSFLSYKHLVNWLGGSKRILCGILHSSSNTCHYSGCTLESKELTNANGFQLKDLFRKRCSRYFPLNSSPSLQCLQCICDNCRVKHRLKLLLRPKGKKLLTFGVDLQTKLMESLFQIYDGTRGSVSNKVLLLYRPSEIRHFVLSL